MTTPQIFPTICETAAAQRVSNSAIGPNLSRGDFPCVKIGYAPRVLRRDIGLDIEAQRVETHRLATDGGEAG